jgi:polar amino acid transport system permease protein
MFGLHFSTVLAETPALVGGLVLTIELSVLAIALGSFVGLVSAALRSIGPPIVEWIVRSYVEIIRNTPFLVQLYIIFFGLPSVGVRVTAFEASIIAMTINLGAYSTEIFRAGIESIHRSQIEAGLALALTRWQIFTRIIMQPAIARVWPSLSSQFILMMLTSSVCSFISVEELSGTAYNIQAQTFENFEVYIVVGLIYLGLAIVLKVALALIGRLFFGQDRGGGTLVRVAGKGTP